MDILINSDSKSQPLRLDKALVVWGFYISRTRAEESITKGMVKVNGRTINRPSYKVSKDDKVEVIDNNPYVSRAGLKLAGANKKFKIDFRDKVVLDVGSSTGGFTDYALQHGAKKIIAVDVGTKQMHPKLASDSRIELHEKTDIREFSTKDKIDIVVCDVSFISLRLIVPHILHLTSYDSRLILMCKPQFEAGKDQVNKGVIKNEKLRRNILNDFEAWLKRDCVVIDKTDSDTPGEKGNIERFFLVKKIKR